MRVLILLSLIALTLATHTVHVCEIPVDVDDSVVQPSLHSVGELTDFNAIVFGDMNVGTGDVAGRAIVQGNFVATGGYSVGCEVVVDGTAGYERHVDYAFITGGSMTFPVGSGDVCPRPNYQYSAPSERVAAASFVGAYTDLANRVDTTPASVVTDLTAAQSYYAAVSAALAQVGNTAGITTAHPWSSAFEITCGSGLENLQHATINIDASDIGSAVTEINVVNCNTEMTLAINIGGTGDVYLHKELSVRLTQSPWTALWGQPERILWNVVGANRNVRVESMLFGTILAPNSDYTGVSGATINGTVIARSINGITQINRVHCVVPNTPNPPRPCVGIESNTCAGYTFTLGGVTQNFADFHAVSFGNFVSTSGDTEGRLIVQGNTQLTTYSVGYEISYALDNHLPYSLVVGGDLTFNGGAVYPDGTGSPHVADREDIFVGGTMTSNQADLVARRVGGPADISGIFSAAQQCYSDLSNTIAQRTDNAQVTISQSCAAITCSDSTAREYTISIDAASMSSYTYYTVSGCNFVADWFINIRGTADVVLTGDTFPSAGVVIYNVVNGAGRSVSIHDIMVNGNVLAPVSTVDQPTGVIVGKLVAGAVTNSLQINIDHCVSHPVVISMQTTSGSNTGATTITVADASYARVNDVTTFGTIIAINGNTITFDTPLTRDVPSGEVVQYQVRSDSGRPTYPNQDTNTGSASMVGLALATIVAALLF